MRTFPTLITRRARRRRPGTRLPKLSGYRLPRYGEVSPGRKQSRSRRHLLTRVAEGSQQGQRKPTACGFALITMARCRRVDAQAAIHPQRVLQCRRKRMFGRKAIGRSKYAESSRGKAGGNRAMRFGGTGVVSPSVQIDQRERRRAGRFHPFAGNAVHNTSPEPNPRSYREPRRG